MPSNITADLVDESVAALQRRVEHLEDMVAARDRFLALAAHELRNPMAPMVLQVGMLLKSARKNDIPRVIEGLELLELIVGRYVKRANVLLDVSRLAADRPRLEPVPIDLAILLRRIVAGFGPVAELAGSDLRIIAPDTLPTVADPMAVEQIVENLLSNALKFGAGKPVTVNAAEVGGAVRLSVRDHGPGISPGDHDRIFAPFEKVMARQDGGGFGVGLWVVGRLVREMRGTVELDSAPGNGATFFVTLPQQ